MAGGVAYNLVRMLRQTDHPLVVVFYFPIVTLPFALPLALPGWVMPEGWQEWALVLAMGVLTQLAQVYLTKAFQAGTTGTVSIVMYVGAVFALAYGYVFFHETYPLTSLIGMVLVVLGVLLNLFLAVPKRP
jgi:drug/metabolite transporter (DMT)-like permease